MSELGKVLIKVVNEEHDRAEWTHISYIDKALYDKFIEREHIETIDLNDYLSRWAKEDFNIDLAMSSKNDIRVLKELVKEFQTKVTAAILSLNEAVAKFNEYIQALNAIRNSQVKANIDVLSVFLRKFGSCKSAGEYAHEQEKIPAEFPSHELYKIEDYIGEVDWSNNEVFLNTFLMSPVFMRMKTRKQNLSLQEHINEFIHQVENIKNIFVVEDSSVDKGGCIVETDFGAIDARISSQLSELETQILSISPIKTVGKSEVINPDL